MTRKVFESMDPDARRFYQRVLNTAMLNAHAVQRGFFDTLISDMTEPQQALRWNEAMPQVLAMIKAENAKGI